MQGTTSRESNICSFAALNLNFEREEGSRIKTDRRESIQSQKNKMIDDDLDAWMNRACFWEWEERIASYSLMVINICG